mgnify:CR=1 FL=1
MKKLQSLLSAFEQQLNETIEFVWHPDQADAYLQNLNDRSVLLSQEMNLVGSAAQALLLEKSPPPIGELFNANLINYLWADQAKSFLILWRDILFQQQKAQLLHQDHRIEQSALDTLKQQSFESVKSAAKELVAFPEREIRITANGRPSMSKRIEEWQLQENPWPIYQKQITDLQDQCQQVFATYQRLSETATTFEQVKTAINRMLTICDQEINSIQASAQETINFIDATIDAPDPKPGKITVRLEDLEEEMSILNHHNSFTTELEKQLAQLPEKTQVSITVSEGLLLYKEINFQKSVQQWLESEILPLLYEVWETTESVTNGMKMSLANIRNRTIILSAETQEGKPKTVEKADLCQPLISFLKKFKTSKENLDQLEDLMEERLEHTFLLSEIFNLEQSFLPISLESTISQLRINQSAQLIRIQNWFNQQKRLLQRFKTTVEREESLSISEKTVRYIQNRLSDENNYHYNSIFLTKGYIGESFWVGREEELRHAENLIQNWKSGFRGAVLITGQRFAGKSLFGELIANRHFPNTTVRLQPNMGIKVNGRSMTTTYHLGEALDFIRKHTLNTQPLVWIDDLELWRAPNISISQNMRALRKFIDSYSNSIFFLVSTSNWLKAHLNKMLDIQKVFQAEINMDRMSAAEIREAILIRHGATHKTLIESDGSEITPQAYRKISDRIIKSSEYNIGEALNRWSASTQRVAEDRIRFSFSGGALLPDFVNSENGLLLAAIMLSKRTNEYRLRKLFGPAFSEKYGSVLQRLLSVGVLTRHLDGWLEVNELVVNDLGRILERKKYLKFHK